MVLEAASAICWRESRKELKEEIVESSWDCREKLSVSKESTRGKEVCNNKKKSYISLTIISNFCILAKS